MPKPNPRRGQMWLDTRGERWTRQMHEESALRDIQEARETAARHYGCESTEAAYALARANRALGRARCHLASIGPDAGPRVRRYWRLAGKAQRAVDLAGDRVAKCFLKR